MNIQRPLLLVLIPILVFASAARAGDEDLMDLDLATLMSMDVTVTSASRRAQSTSDAAAAVFVITREDIRRSGATTIPEVLRMAPGLQVARINTRSWAVTARGLNSRFANKLLVLVDGRSIYTSTFSGVMWEEQPVFLHDIERIEVVRGPGGALWGINAVNGVFNIITRTAANAEGLHVSASAGSDENHLGAVRLGGNLADFVDYRVYASHSGVGAPHASGSPWRSTQAGWRLDRETASGMLTLQADVTESDFGDVAPASYVELPTESQSGGVLASWRHVTTPGELDLRAYYRWIDRGFPGEWDETGLGLDAQFNAERIGRHVFTAGIGMRSDTDELRDAQASVALSRPRLTRDQWSVYGQDEVHFLEDAVRLIIGAKVEGLRFTGLAFQPTVRGLWRVDANHTLWAAASRATRTPSRIELHSSMDLGSPGPTDFSLRLLGDERLEAEDLRAYELGWRWRPRKTIAIDLAVFHNQYNRLITLRPGSPLVEPGPPPRVTLPIAYANAIDSRVQGAELTTQWVARDWLRFEAHGVWHDSGNAYVDATTGSSFGAADPRRLFALRARMDLPRDLELDLSWRSVSALPGFDIDGYASLGARIGWRPVRDIELSFSIDNLFDEDHLEFYDEIAVANGASFGRTVLASFIWRPAP